MTDQEARLFLTDLAIIILPARRTDSSGSADLERPRGAGTVGDRFVKVSGADQHGMLHLGHATDSCQSTLSSSR